MENLNEKPDDEIIEINKKIEDDCDQDEFKDKMVVIDNYDDEEQIEKNK